MEKLINTIFPPKCAFCEYLYKQKKLKGRLAIKEAKPPVYYGRCICKKCLVECKVIVDTNCIECDKPSVLGTTHIKCMKSSSPLSKVSIYDYNGIVRRCILGAKYANHEFMALKELTVSGLKTIKDRGYKPNYGWLVVSIPLSKYKKAHRGFNQADIIAKELSYFYGLRVVRNTLVRKTEVGGLYNRSKVQRKKDLRGAFKTKTSLKNIKVLLVDDICTSGSTLKEASATLYKAGAKEVHCFTLAKKQLNKSKNRIL